jgi:hypothetical protein
MLMSETNFQARHPKLPNWAIPTVYAIFAVAVGLIVPRWEPILLPRIHVSMSTTAAVARLYRQSVNAHLRHYRERLNAGIARSFEDVLEQQEAAIEDRQGLGGPRRIPASF